MWRTIFQWYVEAEVFEDVNEVHRGERSIEESEHRLKSFTLRAMQDQRKLKNRDALETFLELNLVILNAKKVCANFTLARIGLPNAISIAPICKC